MDKVASLPAVQRQELFSETAARMNLLPALIEKDFWVCWILKHLFSIPEIESHILFKGGTTLSKIFGIIERFSEDVDLAVDYKMLGFKGERSPLENLSTKQLNKRLREMRVACEKYISTQFMSNFNKRVANHFSNNSQSFQISVDPSDKQLVNFYYPITTREIEYIRPVVRLELGTRAGFIPNDWYNIKPYAAKHFPAVFQEAACTVRAIKAERTFWEKLTILHQEHHRKKEHGSPTRQSRHYYDAFMLAGNASVRTAALGEPNLLLRVVEHKMRFFRSAWARYDLAVPATLQLLPSPDWIEFLRQDYEKMQVMFFGEIPPFDDIIAGLSNLEKDVRKMVS